ncbi:MAG: glycosyltransferase family 2 protein [Deltaproteobacteria bacterium]|nr:glycosyltransferase family 2 protein [Deltaproteobacteria bacterium]
MSSSISVVMATYNGARFLPEQLASLEAQRTQPEELVVCDDDSRDDTVTVLERFAQRARFPVRIYRNRLNMGSTRAFEKAIRLARAEVVAPCDQDDVWGEDRLTRAGEALAAGASLSFSDADMIDGNAQPLRCRLWQSIGFEAKMGDRLLSDGAAIALLKQNVVTGCTSAFPRRLRSFFLPVSPHWVHDYWIALIAAVLGRLHAIAEPVVRYRQHGGNQIGIDLVQVRRGQTPPWAGADDRGAPLHYSLSAAALEDLRLHLRRLIAGRSDAQRLTQESAQRAAGLLAVLESHATRERAA